MAQLKDLIVTGATRLIGDAYAGTIQITTLNAPTAAGGTTYGPGTNGYVLKSNGSSVYWGSDNNSVTGVKGNAESSYRTGQVNLTAANIGAPTTTGTGASGTWAISISGNAATATKLANITLNSTTINNTAGSFAFSGSGEPWASTDWVGLQIGDGVDKFQIHALNGTHFEYRQNDSGGTNTPWGAWQTYVNRAGDTMSGDLTVSHSSTANSSFNAVNSNGSVSLLASTNRGVYDNTNSKWIIYLNVSDSTVRSNYPIYGAVWNDYAEYRETKDVIEPGRCIREIGDGSLTLTTERLQAGCEIVSDTFGFAIGKNEECQTPTACAGRVLAYFYEDIEIAKSHIGWPVCSGPEGTVSLMTEEEELHYPSRIIGTISEVPSYEIWHAGGQGNEETSTPIKVNGRIWIRIR